ncbi:transposase [Streptomyces sp. NPDC001435]|uniref:transposase n=1 Tax=unclassified Streptomyces TaxID=2593676 RepID=UPI0036987638
MPRAIGPTARSCHRSRDNRHRLLWRLFLPQEGASDTDHRTITRIPPEVTHREKWHLALDMLDTLAALRHQRVSADGAGERGIDYVLAVRSDVSAPFEAKPVGSARNGPSDAGRSPATAIWHHR